MAPTAASAQNADVLIKPILDPVYNRDNNISVTERSHPDYDPFNLRVGSFVIKPSVRLATVFTDNVFSDNNNKRADLYANVLPIVSADSDWSRHKFSIVAASDLRRYVKQKLRNQNAWYVYLQGRIDVRDDFKVSFDAQIDKTFESPFFEDIVANLTVPSTYLRKLAATRATYTAGRSRFTGALDVSSYQFNTIRFGDGTIRDQQFRDRTVYRATGIYEFALSPSVAVYTQLTLDETNYRLDTVGGIPHRDSNEFNLIGGANFDLAGLARGSIGIGFSRRHYNARTVYPPAQGLSGAAKIEFFPTELTTVAATVQRQLQDVSLGNNGAFWTNRISVNVDHELLVNLILSASAEAIRRQYLETRFANSAFQFLAGGRYQASRYLGFSARLSYTSSKPNSGSLGNPYNELSGTVGVTFRH